MNGKRLREGYTTGTCAAIAAKAAAKMLFKNEEILSESITTPRGDIVATDIFNIDKGDDFVSCAVKKDAGDDPDVTNGIMVYAKVQLNNSGIISIDGGVGVGRVTKPGLYQKIGEAAINPVPKRMIEKEVREILDINGSNGGADVVIYIPQGVEIAKKTFNPRLGIEGGISVLGTSGIVEPMSEKALVESIQVEMKVLKATGNDYIIITPGNYGEDFIKNTLGIELSNAVKCSNYIGEAIDMAVDLGFKGILLVGHVGKLVKLAAGIMNTHSHQADARMEIFGVHSAMCGADADTVKKIMASISTDQAIKILKEYGCFDDTMCSIMKRVEFHIEQRCGSDIPIGACIFSTVYGILGTTSKVEMLIDCIKKRQLTEDRMSGILYGIGVGPGDPELMTIKAVKIMNLCDIFALPVSDYSALKTPKLALEDESADILKKCLAYKIAKPNMKSAVSKPILFLPMPMSKDKKLLSDVHNMDCEYILKLLDDGKKIGFLTLGDPSVYSTYLYMHKRVIKSGRNAEIISGIPSFCASAARLGTGLVENKEQLHIIPSSYNIDDEIGLKGTKVLMKAGKKMAEVKAAVEKSDLQFAMVENCGLEGEKVYYDIDSVPDNASYYSLIILKEGK